ncbi:MAG: pseudaminic acid cytidylyltransferase [Candidatus Omnitrophica bacterium]|nr:pseudaminic acid cytidylyltransferase [Candidatus Omnitrophota bacterium]
MSNIAIIPARGGSKRIPRKNIKNFCGSPIIKYPIEAALNSGLFDKVIVSTDDIEISEIGKSYGAEIPFLRSAKTSQDDATTMDVLREVLRMLSDTKVLFSSICCVYPTSVFVTATILKETFKIWSDSSADSLISVVKYSHPIQRAFTINDNIVRFPDYAIFQACTQAQKEYYHDAGQLYWFKANNIFNRKEEFGKQTIPYIFPETEVQDIDTHRDWELSEMKFRCLGK